MTVQDLIYVEYISRRPGVSIEDFRTVAMLAQAGWGHEYYDDRLLLNIGRTWRLGPEPEYLCVWHCPGSGLGRLDEWEEIFLAGNAEPFERPMALVARLDRAGCYVPLLPPTAHSGGRYYLEYFEPASGVSSVDVRTYYEHRQEETGLALLLLALRIGSLGPDPAGLAVWLLPSFASLSTLVADSDDDVWSPARLVACGLYAELGKEIL